MLPTDAPRTLTTRETLREWWRRAVQVARLSIGVPDYDTYVLHLQRNHPDRAIPSYAEFFQQRQDARYRNGGTRGCC